MSKTLYRFRGFFLSSHGASRFISHLIQQGYSVEGAFSSKKAYISPEVGHLSVLVNIHLGAEIATPEKLSVLLNKVLREQGIACFGYSLNAADGAGGNMSHGYLPEATKSNVVDIGPYRNPGSL